MLTCKGLRSTGDAESSGNWGMKDAASALTWVQTNIKSRILDPLRVAVMEENTGASIAVENGFPV